MHLALILMFILPIAASFFVGARLYAAQNVPTSEFDALHEIYISTAGANWTWKGTEASGNVWNFSSINANPCTDRWQGVTCTTVEGVFHISDLSLKGYNMFGTIPEAIGNLTLLETLELDSNRLHGRIPTECWWSMPSLQEIVLDTNRLTGNIPTSLLTALPLLVQLFVNANLLTGQIPPSIGLLSQLHTLAVTTNALNGTLPTALCNLSSKLSLNLGYNEFTGRLPECLGNLSMLTYIDIQGNQLHGPIPASFSQLPHLNYLSAPGNYLTGTLPAFLCDYSNVTALYFGGNQFTGTLPDCLGTLTKLTNFGVENNPLSGTIPQSFLRLPRLLTVWLSNAGLSGPVEVGGQSLLFELLMDNNQLTGTIPDAFSTMAVKYLEMSANFFAGTIPASLGYMNKSEVLFLSGNLLTGSFPASFAGLLNLEQIDVHDNFIGGSLEGVFNAATQVRLLDILVHQNQLTGTLPGELFRLERLNTLIATENCFTGSLPDEACSNKLMISLVLDGLHTSKACRKRLLPAPANAYGIANDFQGTVPACLLQHPRLTSLHLSGNGLTGTLPGNITIHPHLLDLTLSHNALTGTIPGSVQSHSWRTLDLSFNRLTGVLGSDFAAMLGQNSERLQNATFNSTEHSVHIDNNRISGGVPQPLVNLQNVSSLGSNMFSCKVDKSDLPQHDSDRANYQCGSDAFNGPFYVFIILCGIALVVIALAWLYLHSGFAGLRNTAQKWALSAESTPRTVLHVDAASDILCQLGLCCTLLIVLVLMPWYAAASHYYGTYTHQYAWVVSAAFLSGVTPLAVNFTLYCALMIALVVGAGVIVVKRDREERHRSRSTASTRLSKQSADGTTTAVAAALPLWQRALVYSAFLLLNLVVVVGVNAAFVIIALTQSSGALVVAQVALSVFKLLWNTVCTPFLIYLARGYVARTHARASLVTVQVFIGLFNNIAIPCLVVAVLSPSCFYSVFDPPGKVTSNFAVQGCYTGAIVFVCSFADVIRQSTTFSPPFKYDYQCSSSFVTYYAPAFVYLGLAAAFAAPLAKFAGMHLLHRATPGTRWHRILAKLVPRILKPPKIGQGQMTSVDSPAQHPADSSASAAAVFARGLWERYRPIFDANNFIIALITYLGILLTFGVVFPPLAVVMCATMLSVAWQTKLEVGRYLFNAREARTPNLAEGIDKECRGAVSLEKLRRGLFMIICFCCAFYALFLFDTLGNDVGLHRALWVLFVMTLFPLVLYAAIYVRRYLYADVDAQLGYSVDDNICEMRVRAEREDGQTLAVPMTAIGAATGHSADELSLTKRGSKDKEENVTFNAILDL